MEKQSMTRFLVLIGSLVFTSASTPVHAQASYEGVMKTIPYTTIQFTQGSAVLSDSDRTKLHNLVVSAREHGDIAKVSIAAWSDKSLPHNRRLSDSDQELADLRADYIRMTIRNDIKTADIQTFSMAEDSNWLSRLFKTDDSELKSIFSKKGAHSPVTNAEFRVIKNEGGPSSAVVVMGY